MHIAHLPPNDFLRRLPSIMDARQRLTIDVLVHCHDVMVASINRLWQYCEAFNPEHAHPEQVAAMFSEAWRIIDQVDLLRQIYQPTSPREGSFAYEFLEHADKARSMRNLLDHMVQRIPNIAKKTGEAEALFGSISFVRCPTDVLEKAVPGQRVDCEFLGVARGTVPGYKGSASASYQPEQVVMPISNLVFTAHGGMVPLDRMCELQTEINFAHSQDMAAQISEQVGAIAAETGLAEEIITSPTPTIVSFGLKMSIPFGTTPPSTAGQQLC